ncbi:Inhibitor of the KinA pathway to sporulation, predicted exonuclease [Clostridium magnum DSM 2767]|nr:Inhibitor of the KinA pathway to sporulation, predicted exonuclease [Clostridium magnum DSM 2767]
MIQVSYHKLDLEVNKIDYLVFDLEFNQDYNPAKKDRNIITPKCPFEIIQIGAVKLDENLQTISFLDRLVKPQIYTTINPFVKEMTGITMDLLDTAKPFKEIYEEFIEFTTGTTSILCVWGMTDMRELFRNIEYHGLDMSPIPKEYINLQLYASKYFNCSKGVNIGLHNAIELLHIPVKKQFHNAFNDACYTVEVFKKIYNKDIKPCIYNPNKYIRRNTDNSERKKIDTYRLIKQFEKMFNREMSTEEQSIIKLAYMMGKTNQFQTEICNNLSIKKDKK